MCLRLARGPAAVDPAHLEMGADVNAAEVNAAMSDIVKDVLTLDIVDLRAARAESVALVDRIVNPMMQTMMEEGIKSIDALIEYRVKLGELQDVIVTAMTDGLTT